ncbi:hypothetical protein EVAR_82757_1 [Eumeta japonica]|uniref:Uncharacterized protein n=1 Tax=Eumeta variegata TaxID=151549 RepID=A0A4C1UN14_EUMVA|nr:hypothetical protein EVAR_82757_1 [Eumeta japonica]
MQFLLPLRLKREKNHSELVRLLPLNQRKALSACGRLPSKVNKHASRSSRGGHRSLWTNGGVTGELPASWIKIEYPMGEGVGLRERGEG